MVEFMLRRIEEVRGGGSMGQSVQESGRRLETLEESLTRKGGEFGVTLVARIQAARETVEAFKGMAGEAGISLDENPLYRRLQGRVDGLKEAGTLFLQSG